MSRILIVDDSPIDQQVAGMLLSKKLKADVIYASDGVDAIEKINQNAPELVLTDLQMPNMNGLELVALLKEKHPMIPVVLMTAVGSEDIAFKAITAGAASYVAKKRLVHDLCNAITNVLEVSSELRTQFRVLQRQRRWETELVIENDLSVVMGTASHLMQGLRGMGVCDRTEEVRVGVAVTEAILNAFYHGNLEIPSELRESATEDFHELAKKRSLQDPYRSRRIYVEATYTRTEAKISIRDDGKGFDTSNLPDPTDVRSLEKPHGRGLFLMRSFMTDVQFNDVGNSVTMVKRSSKAKP